MRRCRWLFVLTSLLVLTILAEFCPGQPAGKDKNGDALPQGAIARFGSLRWRHNGIVFFAAFLPDGKSVVSVGEDRKIRIWEFPSGVQLKQMELPESKRKLAIRIGRECTCAALSPDSKFMATHFADEFEQVKEPVYLFEMATGKLVRALDPGDNTFVSLSFSPNGKTASGLSTQGNVVTWDWTTGQQVGQIKPAGNNNSNRLDPDNPKLFAYSPDGNAVIFVGNSQSLTVIDVKTGKEVSSSQGTSGPVQAVQFEPDGKHLLTRSATTTVKWEISSGKNVGIIEPDKTKLQYQARLSPDGKVIAQMKSQVKKAGSNNRDFAVFFQDAATLRELGKHPLDSTNTSVVRTETWFSPDSKTLAVSSPGTNKIEILEVPSAKKLQALEFGPDVNAASKNRAALTLFSPDSKMLLAWLYPNKVLFWDIASGLRAGSIDTPAEKAFKLAMYSEDGRCAIFGMSDGTIGIYELATAQPRRIYGKPFGNTKKTLFDAVFDPLASGSSVVTPSTRLSFSPDRKLLAQAGLDRVVHIWHVDTAKELAAFAGHSAEINSIAFAPNGKTIASGSSDTTALLWDLTKLKWPKTNVKPQNGDLERWWEALLSNDAGKGFDAICDLAAAPKEVTPFIKERVKPAAPVEIKRIEELVAQLDDKQYKVREKAASELTQIGERIVPALNKALAADPPLEAKRRLEDLKDKMTSMVLQGERLRAFRAIEILERIGTPEARQVLETLAGGAPGALVTVNARAALKR